MDCEIHQRARLVPALSSLSGLTESNNPDPKLGSEKTGAAPKLGPERTGAAPKPKSDFEVSCRAPKPKSDFEEQKEL